MRGRKPKPTALRVLNGNAGKRALNVNEPRFGRIVSVDPPEYLGELAVEMWQRVVPQLCANDLLTLADLHVVEGFCLAYARWREAQVEINSHGVVVSHPESGVLQKNPALTVMNETARQLVMFGSLLGLDPSSRSRLIGGVKDEAVSNPFADL